MCEEVVKRVLTGKVWTGEEETIWTVTISEDIKAKVKGASPASPAPPALLLVARRRRCALLRCVGTHAAVCAPRVYTLQRLDTALVGRDRCAAWLTLNHVCARSVECAAVQDRGPGYHRGGEVTGRAGSISVLVGHRVG